MKDFPILKNIHYLDNAATTQKPRVVIEAIKEFYETSNANSHRGVYALSEKATKLQEDSRKVIAEFIGAKENEIVFTKSATEALNLLSYSLEVKKDENIVTTVIEHHSNFVPWQQKGAELRIVDIKEELNNIPNYVDENTKIVTFTGMSNVSGLIPKTKQIIKEIRKKSKAIIILDATQLVAHKKVNVKDLDVDYLVFSAHKVYGPLGVGILYGKNLNIKPFLYGGNMISKVTKEKSEWAEAPARFEAGTLDIAGISATAEAIKYFEKNFEEFMKKEEELKEYASQELKKIKDLTIIGQDKENYGSVISFIIKGVHPHDLASIADKHKVCIRAGHHCAQPYMDELKVTATSRASLSFYNTKEDIDKLIEAIQEAIKILR